MTLNANLHDVEKY